MRNQRNCRRVVEIRRRIAVHLFAGICLLLWTQGCDPVGVIGSGDETDSRHAVPTSFEGAAIVSCPADLGCTSLAEVVACLDAGVSDVDLKTCANGWDSVNSLECRIDSIVGDLDGDGQVTSNDLKVFTLVTRGFLNAPSNICCIDVNGNGRLDLIDASLMGTFFKRQCFPRGYTCGLRENCTDKKDNDCDGLVDDADLDCPKACPSDLKCLTLAQLVSCMDSGSSDADLATCASYWESLSGLECNHDTLTGDLDRDGAVTGMDLKILSLVMRGLLKPPADICCLDVNGNQRIEIIDVSLLATFSFRQCLPRGYSCGHRENCTDGKDNDCDRLVDNNDPDCQSVPLKNEKDLAKYGTKQAFLIADDDWRSILSLVPVTVWTTADSSSCNKGYRTPAGVCVYPTLIYHKESETGAIDADAIVSFLQRYRPGSVTVLGSAIAELDNLLTAQPEQGAGLLPAQIQHAQAGGHYTGYWRSFRDVVYVEDDYAKALMASVYASFKNAPLLIKGFNDDIDLGNRNVICVGTPSAACSESLTLEELESRYRSLTGTDRVVLVNPADLAIHETEVFTPERTTKSLSWIYSSTSLAAPILASAKHEVIIGTTAADYVAVDAFLEEKLVSFSAEKGFLTVFAAPNAIPMSRDDGNDIDFSCYSRLGGCDFLMTPGKGSVSVGRIFGITPSDVSGYVARALWYDAIGSVEQSQNVLTYCSPLDRDVFCPYAKVVGKAFADVGYTVSYSEQAAPDDLKDKGIIFYNSHGGMDWAGVESSSLPELSSSFMFVAGCQTCAYYTYFGNPINRQLQPKHKLFCARALRKGAIGYIGGVEASPPPDSWTALFGKLLSLQDDSIGKHTDLNSNFVLLGDPTLVLSVPHRINHVDPWVDELADDGNKVSYRLNLTGALFDRVTLTVPPPYLGKSSSYSWSSISVEVPRKDVFVVGSCPFSQAADRTIAWLGPYQCPGTTFSDCGIDFWLYRYAPDFSVTDIEVASTDGTTIAYDVTANNTGNLGGTVKVTIIDAVDFTNDGVGDCPAPDMMDVIWASQKGLIKQRELFLDAGTTEKVRFEVKYFAGARCLEAIVEQKGEIPEISPDDNLYYEKQTQ